MAAETSSGKIDDILDGMKKYIMESMVPELVKQLSIMILVCWSDFKSFKYAKF